MENSFVDIQIVNNVNALSIRENPHPGRRIIDPDGPPWSVHGAKDAIAAG